MPKRPQAPIATPATGTVFYDAATLRPLGSIDERKEQVKKMARLIGTGKDPEGRYVKDVVFDSPGGSAEYQSLIDKGWARPLPPENDPSRTDSQIANSVVRGDDLSDPVDAALAEKYLSGDESAHDVVHEDAQPDDDPEVRSRRLGGRPSTSGDHAVELSHSKIGEKQLAANEGGGRAVTRVEVDGDERDENEGTSRQAGARRAGTRS